ncbi:MAG: MFS transporter [Actinomycetota bacterium]|nr:MFS transporter [Actinomycetota bacterium]
MVEPRLSTPRAAAARRVRQLLAYRDFRVLLGAQGLAQAADGFAQAIFADRLLLDPLEAGTAGRILALFAVTLIPYSVIAPFLGVFVDRWPRRTILWATNALRAAALIVLAVPVEGSDGAYFLAVVVLLGLGRLFLVTKGASLPWVVHEHDLLRANSVSGGGGMIAALSGGVIGLAILGVVDTRAGLIVGAALYGLAAVIARFISDPMAHRTAAALGSQLMQVLTELIDGLRQIWRRPHARYPVLAVFVVRTAGMLVTVAAILVINDLFAEGADRRWAGALALGTAGLGAFTGILAAPWLGKRMLKPGLIVTGFVISGTGIVALGGIELLPPLLALTFIGGFGTFTAKIAADAQVQEALPDHYRGRAFSTYDILYNLASVFAAGIMVAAGAIGLRILLVSAGVATLLVALGFALAMSRAGLKLTR